MKVWQEYVKLEMIKKNFYLRGLDLKPKSYSRF